jgi:polyisoprenoid-binding protein YceI
MKKLLIPAAMAVLLAGSAFTFINSPDWAINTGFAVKFSDKNADGIFKDLKGGIIFDESNPSAAKFDVTIDVNSINTGNGLKNKHAKSAKWFDAEKYPTIHFTSTAVTKTATGYTAAGELEMHGVRKPLTIPFTFQAGGGKGTFKGSFKVNRTDFGIGEAKGNDKDFTELDITVPVSSK